MKPQVSVIDLGIGNLNSLSSALNFIDCDVSLISRPNLKKVDKVILPGVGNFGTAIKRLMEKGFDDYIKEHVIIRKTPLLGICVGMQMLFEGSAESPEVPGLGFFSGKFEKFSFTDSTFRIPHVGFNSVIHNGTGIFFGLPTHADFYFTHSYFMPEKFRLTNSGMTKYGEHFVSAHNTDLVYGVQFHPEKSQKNGLSLLRSFSRL